MRTEIRYWQYKRSFEDVAKSLTPSFKWYLMEEVEIIPVGFSEWSESILVRVNAHITDEGIEVINKLEDKSFYCSLDTFATDISRAFRQYLNVNVVVSGWSGDLKQRKERCCK